MAVAEEQSFTRAARRLHLAQQSLSQQIAALERALGVRLFDRDSRGTRLSEVGRVFLPEARDLLDRAEAAITMARRAGRGEMGRLRLAFLTSTANYMLPAVVRATRERFPDLTLTTHSGPIHELVAGLRSGDFDVAFTRPPLVADLETRTLVTEPVCAVLPAGHRLAGASDLRLADLADEDWVLTPRDSWPPWHEQYDRAFAEAGFTPRVVQRAAGVASLLGLVAAGVGVTRLARSARTIRRTGVAFVPLTGETAQTVVAWSPPHAHPALHRLLALTATLSATADLTGHG